MHTDPPSNPSITATSNSKLSIFDLTIKTSSVSPNCVTEYHLLVRENKMIVYNGTFFNSMIINGSIDKPINSSCNYTYTFELTFVDSPMSKNVLTGDLIFDGKCILFLFF